MARTESRAKFSGTVVVTGAVFTLETGEEVRYSEEEAKSIGLKPPDREEAMSLPQMLKAAYSDKGSIMQAAPDKLKSQAAHFGEATMESATVLNMTYPVTCPDAAGVVRLVPTITIPYRLTMRRAADA
ncbi:hypothetical protein [Terrihabitans rhizophilus]|uniref:Uncharacterized protein n=1 Tax=Terrihabitans rhizophilus TaxID=3092662 RepID=A0ABU4RU60_9HYPH|nr:hypothetical protein [Terrihabitans sp. PJ23]MDX6807165.1 hypothetical protein [Terrihabitans sp. PJ23]